MLLACGSTRVIKSTKCRIPQGQIHYLCQQAHFTMRTQQQDLKSLPNPIHPRESAFLPNHWLKPDESDGILSFRLLELAFCRTPNWHHAPLTAARQVKRATREAPLLLSSSPKLVWQHRTHIFHGCLNLSKQAEGKAGVAHSRLMWGNQSYALHQKPKQDFGRMEPGRRNREKQAVVHPHPIAGSRRDHTSSFLALGTRWSQGRGEAEGGPAEADHPAQAELQAAANGKSYVLQNQKTERKKKKSEFKANLI